MRARPARARCAGEQQRGSRARPACTRRPWATSKRFPAGERVPSIGRGARAAGDALVIRGEASPLRRALSVRLRSSHANFGIKRDTCKVMRKVAEIVRIPENTVKTRMFYARRRLAELLKSEGIERGWP